MKLTLSKTPLCLLLGSAITLGFSACGENPQSAASTEVEQTSAATEDAFQDVFLQSPPQEAVSVLQAREAAQPGEPIVVKGRIAGTMHPFAEGFALVTLADENIRTCEQIPGDSCPTPWDACCVPNENLSAGRMTIQVLAEDGTPVPQSLKGVQNLEELDTLIVKGTVAEASTPDNLIVNAEGIFRQEA